MNYLVEVEKAKEAKGGSGRGRETSILSASSFCLLFSLVVGMVSAQLSYNFSTSSWPKSAGDSLRSRMGASLLHFHDCFVKIKHNIHAIRVAVNALVPKTPTGLALTTPHVRDASVCIGRVVSLLSLLKLVPTLDFLPSRKETRMVDPWSSTSSYPLSFNDNEILQCPEESPEEQHLRLRVVFVPG
ncbi:cationic peroxidase 1-like, partial [Fagus crenata]